jgi:ABC-type transport system involved in cytochrome c biogenesis ATPase subunit
VLDEPFSNLDVKGIDYLNNVFEKKINDGSSIIFTSHENQGQNFKEINIDDYKN